MIDWLSFSAPLTHSGDVFGGRVMSVTREGEVEWESSKWEGFEGSHDSRCMMRSHPQNPQGMVQISGNPAKYFQGHNLFGSDDVHGLAVALLLSLCKSADIQPTEGDMHTWDAGFIKLSRVDVTYSFAVGTRERVRTVIRSLEHHARLSYRGRGTLTKESTLYYGKSSRRWSLKIYSKGDEIEAKDHQLPPALKESYPDLSPWANDKLRCEVVMRGLELSRLKLDTTRVWQDNTASILHRLYMDKLEISEGATLSAPAVEGLRPAMQAAYQCWLDGHDVRQIFPRMTFYRYRQALLKHGIDLALKRPRAPESNVVPLRVIIHAHPAGIPDFAKGTPLLYSPRSAVAA